MEHLPENKNIWLVFDLNNGHKPTRRYVWWFDSKEDALKHIKFQRKKPDNAELSEPVEYQRIKQPLDIYG